MECLNTAGLRLKLDKCHFFQDSITYLGHIVDKEGLWPHPDKIKAIAEIPEPKNQPFFPRDGKLLGMVNYYDHFVPDLATTCAPLNSLLQKNTQWNWTSQHVEAVTAVKKLLTSGRSTTNKHHATTGNN